MSRARMVKRRLTVVQQQRMRRMTRRNHECRVRHWRQMLKAMEFDGWRRPAEQDARVACMIVRCREHRSQAAITMVISRTEEYAAVNNAGLLDLISRKMLNATRTIHKMLIPQRYRREFAA